MNCKRPKGTSKSFKWCVNQLRRTTFDGRSLGRLLKQPNQAKFLRIFRPKLSQIISSMTEELKKELMFVLESNDCKVSANASNLADNKRFMLLVNAPENEAVFSVPLRQKLQDIQDEVQGVMCLAFCR